MTPINSMLPIAAPAAGDVSGEPTGEGSPLAGFGELIAGLILEGETSLGMQSDGETGEGHATPTMEQVATAMLFPPMPPATELPVPPEQDQSVTPETTVDQGVGRETVGVEGLATGSEIIEELPVAALPSTPLAQPAGDPGAQVAQPPVNHHTADQATSAPDIAASAPQAAADASAPTPEQSTAFVPDRGQATSRTDDAPAPSPHRGPDQPTVLTPFDVGAQDSETPSPPPSQTQGVASVGSAAVPTKQAATEPPAAAPPTLAPAESRGISTEQPPQVAVSPVSGESSVDQPRPVADIGTGTVTAAAVPPAQSSTVEVPHTLIARVEQAIDMMENAPPPRQITIEADDLDGIRLTVALRPDGVAVSSQTADSSVLDAIERALAARGFDLSDSGRDRRRPAEQDEQDGWRPTANPRQRQETRDQGIRL